MENPAPNSTSEQRPAGPKWQLIALFLSLAVNLAVAGLSVGVALHDRPDRPRGGAAAAGFGVFDQALTRADRMALRRQFMAEAGPMPKDRAELRAEVSEIVAVLRALPFEPDQVKKAMDDLATHGRERLALGQKLLTDRIVSMTAEERAKFADRLEAIISRRIGGPKVESGE